MRTGFFKGWQQVRIPHPKYGTVPAGYVKNRVFGWEIDPKAHLFRECEGVAKDADLFDNFIRVNCERLWVRDKRSGVVYKLSVREFEGLKREIEYQPYGRQYVVPLKYWHAEYPAGFPRQMRLDEMLKEG